MEDNYLNINEEEEFSHLISKSERAFKDGSLSSLKFSEDEFDFLISHFMGEDHGVLVYALADMAYTQHPYSSDLVIKYVDILIVNLELEKALQIIDKQFPLDPRNPDLLFLYGRANLKKGNHDIAKEYIYKAISVDEEDSADMLLTASQDYIEDGEFENALNYLQDALIIQRENNDVINDIAFCYERLNKFDQSLEYYEKYLDNDPFNDSVWFNVGTIYARKLNFEKALESYDYALALNPGNSSVLYNKAIVFVNSEEYRLAIETFEEFLKLEPDNLFAFIALADAYLAVDELDDAILNFRKVLELDKKNIEANTGLAYLFLLKQDHYSALVYLRRIMGDESVDYNFINDLLYSTFIRTNLAEFLVYSLVCMYNLRQIESFKENIQILISLDSIWMQKLYELAPALKKDRNLLRHIKKLTNKTNL